MEFPRTKGRAAKIADLNDQFRHTFVGGRVFMTSGVNALDDKTRIEALRAVRLFKDFTPDNDPHEEHDFGSIEVAGVELFWKIDYYDPTITYHSDDPTDSSVTIRVMTIMLTEEY
jgi:Protein of unknown function (DUF3768)